MGRVPLDFAQIQHTHLNGQRLGTEFRRILDAQELQVLKPQIVEAVYDSRGIRPGSQLRISKR